MRSANNARNLIGHHVPINGRPEFTSLGIGHSHESLDFFSIERHYQLTTILTPTAKAFGVV
jgi:hypothetical protein